MADTPTRRSMIADRELLGRAAQAAGIERAEERFDSGVSVTTTDGRHRSLPRWNPLEDDGDALQLAVALHMNVEISSYGTAARAGEVWGVCEAHLYGGIKSATRRAIVRAAAEMAKEAA